MNSRFKSIRFGSLLVYATKGTCEESIKSRDVTNAIKQDRLGWIEKCAKFISNNRASLDFIEIFAPDAILVPVPRSTPLLKGALWPAERICESLVREGLGKSVLRCVERKIAIRPSSRSSRGNRPTVNEHLDTLEFTMPTVAPKKIILIDDVVTRGCSLVAVALAIKAASPTSEISAFALIRTMGFVPQIRKFVEPCVGEISYDGSAVKREP